MTFLLFTGRHALVLAVLAATAWSAGRLAMSLRLRRRPPDSDAAGDDDGRSDGDGDGAVPWPMTVAIGLAILAQASLLLGLLGWLLAPIVAALAIGVNVAAAGAWRRAAADVARTLARARLRRREVATSAAVAALACPPFLLALYPPLGFDQTLYHLPYARAFAASGGMPFLPALRYPVFPQLVEALNAAVLLFGDDVSTQMTGWLALVTCAGLAFAWARDRSNAAGGWMAAAMLAGSPIAVYLAGTGYVEPMLGLFGLASLYAADRARRRMDARWIIAAGALAGSAASVKYLGLFFVPAVALLLIARGVRPAGTGGKAGTTATVGAVGIAGIARIAATAGTTGTAGTAGIAESSRLRALAWYSVAAVVALAPTYGRLIALTGNPLFPFYPALFGGSAWEAQEYLGKRGVARLVAVSTFLWDVTFRRHAVGGLPFWSPAFAFGAPIALWDAWRRPALGGLLLVAVGYLLVAPVNSHYFFGIAPLWCVIVGVAASRAVSQAASGARQRLLLVAAMIIALGGDAYTLYRVHKLGLPPSTPDGRERLLSAELPLYPAIAFLNRTAGPVVIYGVNAENMVDYAAGTLLGDYHGPASYTHVAERAHALGSLALALDEVRASYLLIPASQSSWSGQAAVEPRLSQIYSDGGATIYRVRAER